MVERKKDVVVDETTPHVTLAGERWPIPRLALAQNSQVFEPFMRRLGTINAVIGGLRGPVTAETAIARLGAITTEDIADFATVVFWGLTRAHTITRAEFDGLPIAVPELVPAALVVAEQAGMFKVGPAKTNGVSSPLEPAATGLPTG